MAKGISINFLADVRDFLKGTKNVEDGLDDVADSLDDVARDGEKSTEKLEDGFRELAKSAKKSGDDVGDSMSKGFKKAESGMDDFKQEANSTAKESAASFDGSAESIVDSFQEIAANAFEGFGPAGAVAGLAVAAGIGIATAEFQKTQEEAQKAKERTTELGLAIIESGSDVAGMEAFNEQLKLIVTNAEDAPKKLEDIEKFAKKYPALADDVGTMAAAYAGNGDALDDMILKLEEEKKLTEETTSKTAAGTNALRDRANAYGDEINSLKAIQEETERAKEIEADYLASGGAETIAKAAAIESINAAYDNVASSVLDYVNAETGVLDVDAYLAAIDARAASLAEYQEQLSMSGLTTEQKTALDDMGIESATVFMDAYVAASPEQKKRMEETLTKMASDTSGVAKDTIDKTFATPTEAKIQATLDEESVAEVNRAISRQLNEKAVKITVTGVDKNGKYVF